jgi:uncharacterized protein YpuA (DUF1002 family)
MENNNSSTKRLSSSYLENLKNKAALRIKVKESIDIFPKDYDVLLTSGSRKVRFI